MKISQINSSYQVFIRKLEEANLEEIEHDGLHGIVKESFPTIQAADRMALVLLLKRLIDSGLLS